MKIGKILAISAIALACGCGSSSDSNDKSASACEHIGLYPKIINGQSCGGVIDSPVVRIYMEDYSGDGFACTGSMITKDTVLTAAHCVIGIKNIGIVLGENDKNAVFVPATSWHYFPGYDGNHSDGDVAILKLKKEVSLPTLPILTSRIVKEGERTTIFGYGKDENGNFDFYDLKSGYLTVDRASTSIIYKKYTGEDSNTCNGDSGGPIVVGTGSSAAVAGVTSAGTAADCGAGDDSYFAALQSSAVVSFIKSLAPNAVEK